jgi:hypothetical protein
MRSRSALALAAVLGLLVAVTGCGGSGSDEEDGTTRFEHDGVSLTYPAGWSRDDAAEAQAAEKGMVLLAKGDSGVEGVPYRLTVLDQPREGRTAASMGKFVADTRASDVSGTYVEDGPVEVDGTPEAWGVVTDYRAIPDGGGDAVPARWIDRVWIDGERQINVRLTGPRDKLGSPEAEAIIGSLRAG